MRNLSALEKKITKLELCREFLDRAPEFDAFEEIKVLALLRLSSEEIDLLLALHSAKQGRELHPMGEVSAAQKAALSALNQAVQKECERFGITIEQYHERRGLAKPLVRSLQHQQMERNRLRSAFRTRPRTKMMKSF
jgi:hypothetical protein